MKVESESRETAYRFVVYSAVAFSFVSVLAVFITLPLANQYINSVYQRVQNEMEFCKMSAKEVMVEMGDYLGMPQTEEGPDLNGLPELLRIAQLNGGLMNNGTAGRKKRQAGGQCEGCCLPGLPGAPGPSGRNGVPGRPGAPGAPGFPGRPPAICEEVTQPPCIQCPPGEPGPIGPTGDVGNRGPIGHPGRPGNDGAPGLQGAPGEQGSAGEPGNAGPRGEAGRPAISTPALPGNPGSPGETGPAGLPGDAGEPGRHGAEGLPGPQGPPGAPGRAGPQGVLGERGTQGQQGPPGERGICPKYCALDGGVFFEDGTRR